jgi:hypothetical protein
VQLVPAIFFCMMCPFSVLLYDTLLFFRGVDPRPPGGFVSYLGNPSSYPLPQQPPNQQAMLQHLHYSGGPSHYVPCPAPQPSPTLRKPRTPVPPSGSQQTINVDGAEDGDKRTEKRLAWTSQEDVRLVSFLCTHI